MSVAASIVSLPGFATVRAVRSSPRPGPSQRTPRKLFHSSKPHLVATQFCVWNDALANVIATSREKPRFFVLTGDLPERRNSINRQHLAISAGPALARILEITQLGQIPARGNDVIHRHRGSPPVDDL
jgi:hypothetical protein